MPIGPLSLIFPIGGVIALLAIALRGTAEAAEEEKEKPKPKPPMPDLLPYEPSLPHVQRVEPSKLGPYQTSPLPQVQRIETKQEIVRPIKEKPSKTVKTVSIKKEPSITDIVTKFDKKEVAPKTVKPTFEKSPKEIKSLKDETLREVRPLKDKVVKEIKPSKDYWAAKAEKAVSKEREVKPSPVSIIKEVQTIERDAAPFVQEAIKSEDPQKMKDAADSIAHQWPKAANALKVAANKQQETIAKGQKVLKDAEERERQRLLKSVTRVKEPSKVATPSKAPSKVLTQPPKVTPVKAESRDDVRTKNYLISEGIESDMEPTVRSIINNENYPQNELRALVEKYKKSRPVASSLMSQTLENRDMRAALKQKGLPSNPSGLVKAANATNNPSTLIVAANALKAQGKPETADAVRNRAKTEAAKQGLTILDRKEVTKLMDEVDSSKDPKRLGDIAEILRKGGYKNEWKSASLKADRALVQQYGFQEKPKEVVKSKEVKKVETKTVTAPSGVVKTVPVVVKVTAKESEADKKAFEKSEKEKAAKKVADDIALKKKEKEAAEVRESARKIAEAARSGDPLAGLRFSEDLEKEKEKEKKEKEAKLKAKTKARVSGNGAFNGAESSNGAGGFAIISPIEGVSDGQWASFVKSMTVGKTSNITPTYRLGMFGIGMRRLSDFGLVDNVRKVDFYGNSVWNGDWVEPYNLNSFLRNVELQYDIFSDDMGNKADYIQNVGVVGTVVDGSKASLSGLLAVAFHTTEPSFNGWLKAAKGDRARFPSTMAAFQKSNGIF